MPLSDDELKKLAELEKQFESRSPLRRVIERSMGRHPQATRRTAWVLVATAAPSMLLLLRISVAASFVCFLLVAVGVGILVRGGAIRARIARLRHRQVEDPGS